MILSAQASAFAGGALVLNPQTHWQQGWGDQPETNRWTMTPGDDGSMRFEVDHPGHVAVLTFNPTALNVDPQRTPVLSMTYRATGLRAAEPDRKAVVFYGGDDYLTVFEQRDLKSDGQVHTVRKDLREALAAQGGDAGWLKGIDLRVHAGDDQAVFELIDLRLEADPDGPPLADAEPQPAVSVRVTDAAGDPVAGAQVVLDPHLREAAVRATTDDRGRATLTPGGADLTRRTVTVAHPGMTGLVFRRLKKVEPDTELHATLYPAATYGGVVVDEAGEPIAGAVGVLWFNGLDHPSGPGRPRLAFYKHRVVTGPDGRWEADLPETPDLSVQVRWMDTDYLADQWGGQFSGNLAMTDLREGTARSVLPKGIQVTGQVFDHDGQPLAGAYVAQGDDRFPSNAPPATHTDAEGRFTFNNTQPGRLILTVTAKDHAPQLLQTTAAPGIEPIDFRLEQAAVFRFRVVDSQGQPIANASVCPDTWKGLRTIPGRVHTNEQGEATWHGPHDPVEFDVFASREYNQNRGVVFSPSIGEDDVHVITLGEPLRVTATVTDAQTGEPITRFSAIPGIIWENRSQQAPYFERNNTKSVRSDKGKWEHTFGYPKPLRVIRIEAEGYAPAVSEPFTNDAGHVQLSFALEPAEPLAGTLVDAADQPVAGVSVYLSMGSSAPYIRNGRVERNREHPVAVTGADGGFVFPPQDDKFLLIALHDAGYAEVTGTEWTEADGKLALKPWARITGRVLVGDQPGAGTYLLNK